jgi:hypothetical protein
MDPRTRSFERGRGPKHRGVSVPGADNLQTNREAFVRPAAWNADSGMSCQVEQIEIGHLALALIARILVADGDRFEGGVIRRKWRSAHRWG